MSIDAYHILDKRDNDIRYFAGEPAEVTEKLRKIDAEDIPHLLIIDTARSWECKVITAYEWLNEDDELEDIDKRLEKIGLILKRGGETSNMLRKVHEVASENKSLQNAFSKAIAFEKISSISCADYEEYFNQVIDIITEYNESYSE